MAVDARDGVARLVAFGRIEVDVRAFVRQRLADRVHREQPSETIAHCALVRAAPAGDRARRVGDRTDETGIDDTRSEATAACRARNRVGRVVRPAHDVRRHAAETAQRFRMQAGREPEERLHEVAPDEAALVRKAVRRVRSL
jgi:hypothetical protein